MNTSKISCNRYFYAFSLLFIGYFFQPTSLFSQNYLPGFVINQDGDSLRGYILFEDHMFNRGHCLFKSSLDAPQKSFSPTDIRTYGVDGIALFRSWELEKRSGKKKLIFLEYMLQGAPSLLFYGSKYFLEEGNNVIELDVKKDTVSQEGKIFIQEGQVFRNFLIQQFGACSDMLDMLEDTKSGGTYLYDIVKTYHECQELSYQSFVSKKKWVQLQLGAGVSGNRFNYFPKRFAGSTYYFEGSDPLWSYFIGRFVRLHVSYPRLNSRWAVRTDLIFSQIDFSISEINDRAGIDLLYEMDIATSALEVPITLAYNLTKSTNRVIIPYVFAGVGVGLPLGLAGKRRTLNTDGTQLSRNFLFSLNSFALIKGGFGTTFKLGNSITGFFEFWGERTNGYIVPDDNNVLLYRRNLGLKLGAYFLGVRRD